MYIYICIHIHTYIYIFILYDTREMCSTARFIACGSMVRSWPPGIAEELADLRSAMTLSLGLRVSGLGYQY